jgi:hypothetical protein
MRIEDWRKWLDSQFVDEEEKKAPEPPRAVQETLLFDTPDEPSQARADTPTQAVIEQPIAPSHTARRPEAAAPSPPEPSLSPPSSPTPDDSSSAPQESSGNRRDLPEEIEVPSIERYLPFLFGRQSEEATGEVSEESEPSSPEIVTHAVMEGATESLRADLEEASQQTMPIHETIPETILAEAPQPEATPSEMSSEPVSSVQETTAAVSQTIAAPVEANSAAVKPPSPSEPQTSPAAAGTAPRSAPKPENRRYGISRRRSRHARNIKPTEVVEEISAESLWGLVPRHIQTLIAIGAQTEVAQNSYKRQFKESRLEMIQRLLDPTLSLADTARLLNVCPTTVRRYTNKGLLTHQRQGKDRRSFKLSDVLAFLEAQSQARSRQP